MKNLAIPERLIVAADFKPTSSVGKDWIRGQILSFADSISDTRVYIKVNSALRACGYGLIDEIHQRGLGVFADLKLFDIPETLSTDGSLLQIYKPEILTVVCTAGINAMIALKNELPDTEILGVTVLTSQKEDDSQSMFSCSVEEAVMRFAEIASLGELDGLISSAKEVEMLKAKFGIFMSLNTPAIRPLWTIVPGDDQNPDRVMTPAKAITLGADRLVVGRPITQAKVPREAVIRTLQEIEQAVLTLN